MSDVLAANWDADASAPVGRLAPSPTGVLHLGNARSLVLAWLAARSRGGRVLLRVEDLLPGEPALVGSLLRDLTYIGLDWDDPGPIPGANAVGAFLPTEAHRPDFVLQSQRHDLYQAVAQGLQAARLVYPCICTRKDIEQAVRAPHREAMGHAYPGTCAGRFRSVRDALAHEARISAAIGRAPLGAALRMRVPEHPIGFVDRLAGPQQVSLPDDSGDIVVRRKDGAWAYMLAVVVDDMAMGVTQVVRGDDLLACTAQQLAIHAAIEANIRPEALGCARLPAPPEYLHVPLVLGDDGRRLAKRDRSLHVQTLQAMGIDGARVRRWLARSLNHPETDDLGELAAAFDWRRVPREAVVFGAAALAEFSRS